LRKRRRGNCFWLFKAVGDIRKSFQDNDITTTRALIETGWDVNASEQYCVFWDGHPLDAAIISEDFETEALFLKHGAEVNRKLTVDAKILRRGLDIDELSYGGSCGLLHFAVCYASFDAMTFLLDNGVDCHDAGFDSNFISSALDIVVRIMDNNHGSEEEKKAGKEVVVFLKSKGLAERCPELSEGDTALSNAAAHGLTDVCEMLLGVEGVLYGREEGVEEH
jgi:hypothetical protein